MGKAMWRVALEGEVSPSLAGFEICWFRASSGLESGSSRWHC